MENMAQVKMEKEKMAMVKMTQIKMAPGLI